MSARSYIDQMVKEGKLSTEAVHEVEERAREKVAALGDIWRGLAQGQGVNMDELARMLLIGAGAATGGVVAGTAAQKGVELADIARHAVTKNRNFNRMLEYRPELENYDQTEVHRAFDTLHRFNPEVAADPYVAGTFVKNVMDMREGIPHKTVGELVSIRKNLGQPAGAGLSPAAGGAFLKAIEAS